MKKLILSPLREIGGKHFIRTSHLVEASLYYAFDCFTYSYNIRGYEKSVRGVEFVISGDDIMCAYETVMNKNGEVKIRNFINWYNYMVDFEKEILKDFPSFEDEEGGIS